MIKRLIVTFACALGMYAAIMASARSAPLQSVNTCTERGCFSYAIATVKIAKRKAKTRVHVVKDDREGSRAYEAAKRKALKRHSTAPKPIVMASADPSDNGGSYSYTVTKAEAYIGKTARDLGLRHSLWCAAFANKVLGGGTGSDLAFSYRSYGTPARPGCIGCIVVSTRRGGGHVGFAKFWRNGVPIIVSGNHGRRVGVGYPPGRVVALRWP